jgi:hypothetical protein
MLNCEAEQNIIKKHVFAISYSRVGAKKEDVKPIFLLAQIQEILSLLSN